MTDPREEKLPKWARDELFRLRQQVQELTESVATMEGRPGVEKDCQGFYSRTFTGGEISRVPVLFGGLSLDWKLRDECFITLRPETVGGKRYLGLNAADFRGSSDIIVRPWAANSILVRVGE